jgi:predicted metal-dependent HD superfamily phosphohydrolase
MLPLKTIFSELFQKYSEDKTLKEKFWNEIVSNYSNKKRHYHNLLHLENLVQQLSAYREIISDWDVILFSVFYHDVIYNTLKQDNEEKSALFAEEKLKIINAGNEQVEKCKATILATKSHELNKDNDINLFTDADLSILGANWNDYNIYAKQIRQEYSIYPDLIYNPGRKKVLHHFLHMKNIFKTAEFSERLEKQARLNLEKELREL